ncbi:NAD(P)-binding domain [Phytophthora cactorum]|nr:NAD(P)-binding domain [Phytophthora cactorum]
MPWLLRRHFCGSFSELGTGPASERSCFAGILRGDKSVFQSSRSWLWRATRFINNPGNQYRITVLDPGIQSSTCITVIGLPSLASKSNGGASVVQLSPFLGSIGGYTNDTADFRSRLDHGYSSSNTALNMITRSPVFYLRPSKIVVVWVHPHDSGQGRSQARGQH